MTGGRQVHVALMEPRATTEEEEDAAPVVPGGVDRAG
jgi:hypothetical protein